MRRQRLVAKLLKKFPNFLLSSWTAVDVNETRPYIREPVATGAKKWERNYQQKVSYIDRSRERCAGTTWRLLGRKTLIRIGCRRGGHGLLASKHSGYSTSFLFKPFFLASSAANVARTIAVSVQMSQHSVIVQDLETEWIESERPWRNAVERWRR